MGPTLGVCLFLWAIVSVMNSSARKLAAVAGPGPVDHSLSTHLAVPEGEIVHRAEDVRMLKSSRGQRLLQHLSINTVLFALLHNFVVQ